MIDVTPMIKTNSKVIQSYDNGTFKVSGKTYSGPILVFPDRVMTWNIRQDFNAEQPSIQDYSQLSAARMNADVVLYGCGERSVFIPPDFIAIVKKQGLPLDVMTTPAACRTYNVLLSEGRRVVAALLPVSGSSEDEKK